MSSSILDDLGQEVTGIVAPVSICMFLTVLLVRLLNPDGISNPSAVAIAQTFYKEQVLALEHLTVILMTLERLLQAKYSLALLPTRLLTLPAGLRLHWNQV